MAVIFFGNKLVFKGCSPGPKTNDFLETGWRLTVQDGSFGAGKFLSYKKRTIPITYRCGPVSTVGNWGKTTIPKDPPSFQTFQRGAKGIDHEQRRHRLGSYVHMPCSDDDPAWSGAVLR